MTADLSAPGAKPSEALAQRVRELVASCTHAIATRRKPAAPPLVDWLSIHDWQTIPVACEACLTAFVAREVAAEREACAKIADFFLAQAEELIAEALAAERYETAKRRACDADTAQIIAQSIRARAALADGPRAPGEG